MSLATSETPKTGFLLRGPFYPLTLVMLNKSMYYTLPHFLSHSIPVIIIIFFFCGGGLILNIPVNCYDHVGTHFFMGRLNQGVNKYFVHILLLVFLGGFDALRPSQQLWSCQDDQFT